jgi:hypothetical protein
MRSEFLTAVKTMLMLEFVAVTPCELLGRYQRFWGTYCLHLHGWRPASPHVVTTQKANIDRLISCIYEACTRYYCSITDTEQGLRPVQIQSCLWKQYNRLCIWQDSLYRESAHEDDTKQNNRERCVHLHVCHQRGSNTLRNNVVSQTFRPQQ